MWFFCWVPGHVGLSGSEKADSAARQALNEEVTQCQVPTSDLKPIINSYITHKWQSDWDPRTRNKRNEIYEMNPTAKKRFFFSPSLQFCEMSQY